ncbi:MAG: SusD/RagB family nutrient-binding outer membrane lipoprotein [Bacteroidales bacterium]|nr:SusD/RagB family nutrient-binding outer membrane lipoprotein [Bacteroidales bacterium]MBR5907347.1 SusD/RagB family nutrient-binding outer membrane lipoprotein [Bacteroidales bacterium]
MKKIYTIILIATLGLFTTGCDHYLDVNKNVDAPDEQQVEDYMYLAGIESALQGLYWDIRATGVLSQMMGTSSYTGFCNNYWTPSDSGGEMWRVTYWLQGMNLENLIKYAVEHERWTMAGIGYTLKAHSWDVTTKENGEMPLRQAFVPGVLAFDYQYQDEIYDSIQSWARRAIDYFEMTDNTNYGSQLKDYDIIYGGNKTKWLQFAHGVICRNLASLTRKSDFLSKYADELIAHGKLAMQSVADDCVMQTPGGGADAQFGAYNNFWCPRRGNLSNSYWQGDFIVKIMTGTVPLYDHATGDIVKTDKDDSHSDYYPYKLNPNQIICDTNVDVTGHYDPRVAAKLATRDNITYEDIDKAEVVKYYKYYGAQFTNSVGYQGWTTPNFYTGRAGYAANVDVDGIGRWLYRENAPYIIMTSAEIQFEMAEAYWYKGDKANALACWKRGVELDMEFTEKYLYPGSKEATSTGFKDYGSLPGGDKIATKLFNSLAKEYLAGPFVAGINTGNLTLSHIMMQKYVHLFPWGAYEAWVDLRKYHYDIAYTGDYPSNGNGWTVTAIDQKWDEDATKVYKGFYMKPAQVQGRRTSFNQDNLGSPAYRMTPRYNSEYMWNKPALKALKPIPGLIETATGDAYKNYHISMPWFAYPGDMPESLPY